MNIPLATLDRPQIFTRHFNFNLQSLYVPLYRRDYRADDAHRIDGGKSHGRKRYRLRLQSETNRLRAKFVRSEYQY